MNLSYYDTKRGLILPKDYNPKLAEFLGILTGDGYINIYKKYNNIIEIAGHSESDYEYLSVYVTNLIKNLFNITPKIIIKKGQNSMYLRIMSKGLVNYLINIGFKKGRKNQIGIPKWILKNDENFCSFVKGLADTDFSLVLLNRNQKNFKYYPRISLRSKSKILVKLVNQWLISKNFNTYTQFDYIQKDKRGYNDSILHTLHITLPTSLFLHLILRFAYLL